MEKMYIFAGQWLSNGGIGGTNMSQATPIFGVVIGFI